MSINGICNILSRAIICNKRRKRKRFQRCRSLVIIYRCLLGRDSTAVGKCSVIQNFDETTFTTKVAISRASVAFLAASASPTAFLTPVMLPQFFIISSNSSLVGSRDRARFDNARLRTHISRSAGLVQLCVVGVRLTMRKSHLLRIKLPSQDIITLRNEILMLLLS